VLFATYIAPAEDMITRAVGVTQWSEPAALSIQELTPKRGVKDSDQPYGVASRVKGSRTFVLGLNQTSGVGGKKCTHGVVWLLGVSHAGSAACVAQRDGQLTEAVRPAVSASGTVYALFLTTLEYPVNDLVLMGGTIPPAGPPAFAALREAADTVPHLPGSGRCASGGDGKLGVRLRRCVAVADDQQADSAVYPPPMGFQVRGSNDVALAIDPRDDSHLVIAYGDSVAGDLATLHLVDVKLSSPSVSRFTTWTEKELTIVHNGLNPAVAIDAEGRVGFLYQRFDSTATQSFWSTHLEISNGDSSVFQDVVLSRTPGRIPNGALKTPYIGDYLALQVHGTTFYGVFSADNDPRFHCDVRYTRQIVNAQSPCATRSLPAGVAVSIDPFFFKLERP
jgi:hypothetical protein